MANEIKEGAVSVTLPDALKLPAEAGSLDADAIRRIEKTRSGLGVTCQATAASMAKKGDEFQVPGVTAAELADLGLQADLADQVIEDLRTILHRLQQGNLLIDAKAQEMLRRVNAQVNAQGKFDANLFERFATIGAYFGRN